jgi:probable HAF family extracellular repeat protein
VEIAAFMNAEKTLAAMPEWIVQDGEWLGFSSRCRGNVINLGVLPGQQDSMALGINDLGQVVGTSYVGGTGYATEWSGGNVINLGGLPGSTNSSAKAINDAGQLVGYSEVGGTEYATYATEWSGTGPPVGLPRATERPEAWRLHRRRDSPQKGDRRPRPDGTRDDRRDRGRAMRNASFPSPAVRIDCER